MNKILVPSILVITVLVAGIFAFIPVNEASTVHTTIIDSTITRVVDSDQGNFNAGESLEVTCTGGSSLVRAIALETAGGTNFDAADDMSISFDVDGGGALWTEIVVNADIFGASAPTDAEILERAGIVAPLPLTSGGTVTIDFVTEGSVDTQTVRAMFIIDVDSSTTCSATGTN